ncbi:addiction module antidote protein [Psychrobacter sp. I-STPA6b]|uniref:addiction module antidote protein n=1 Tax=Psychrobacter sp. I-STPA6b TaxID=2585718 RepID=UPI001D0C5932|nr:addiction module antidote protein [Psychrobacter sp. I-STPA6b]
MIAEKIEITPFDVAECLNDDETIQAYLNEVLAEGTASEFVQALNDVARAKGMNDIAQKSGIGRTTLYKSLSSDKPRFETLFKVLDSMGLQFQIANKA